jgi:adenine deaminase
LVEKGYMECVVQRAIDLGFDPVLAIQMATLNVAEHFGLDNILGGIAPGKCADMVIIPDLHTIKAQYVLSNGRFIVEDAEIRVEPRVMPPYIRGFKEIQVNPSDFAIRTESKGPLRVRVVKQLTELVTREAFLDLVPSCGELKADPEHDLLKVSLISGEGHIFTGLIRGHGFKKGAMATSGLWETLGTLVVGANDTDMAAAVNRVHELGGGIVLCAGMQVQAEIDLSISGIMSTLPIEALTRGLRQIQEKAEALGFRFPDAALTLATLTTPAIPFLRLSEEGLVDVRKGQVVEFMVSL